MRSAPSLMALRHKLRSRDVSTDVANNTAPEWRPKNDTVFAKCSQGRTTAILGRLNGGGRRFESGSAYQRNFLTPLRSARLGGVSFWGLPNRQLFIEHLEQVKR